MTGVKTACSYAVLVTSAPDAPRVVPRRGTTEVRDALLQAAAELFAAKGYSGTSTKEIARAANTSETTIYRQFGSKADLFSSAVLEPFSGFLTEYQDFFQTCMAQESWTDQEITRQSVDRLYHYLRQNRNSVLAMISVHADPDSVEPAQQAARRLDEFFDALLEIGMERWRRDPTGFDAGRLRLVHRFLVGVIFSISALDRWFVPHGNNEPTPDELVHAMTEFIIHGVVDNPHGTPNNPSNLPDQLQQLATMHQDGALTDGEFTAAKAKLLA